MTEGGAAAPPGSIVVRRPIGVLLLALYDFVAGGFFALGVFDWFAFSDSVGRVGGAIAGVFLVSSLARIAAGIGLLGRRRWGRTLQIVVSIPSILNFPVGTAMAIVSFVYLTRPLVKLWFARSDPEEWSQGERDAWRTAGISTMQPGALVTLLVAGAFAAIAFIVLMAAIAIPNFLNAVDRGKQKRTMADMRVLAAAVDAYATDAGLYPVFGREWRPVTDLRPILEPKYIKAVPTQDGWGNPLRFRSVPPAYQIVSLGKGGEADVEGMEYVETDYEHTNRFDADILIMNGKFARYPDGIQH